MTTPKQEIERRLKGRSLRALAKELNVSAGHLCHVLKGSRGPGEQLVRKLGLEVTYRRERP